MGTNTPSSFVKASKMVSFRSSVSAVWLIIVLLAASKDVEAQSLNATFAPWTVMGPVNTNGSGYVATNFTGESLSYSVSLFNVVGLHSVEIHVGDVNTHGEGAAVLYAAAFPDASSLTNGVACAGTLEPTGCSVCFHNVVFANHGSYGRDGGVHDGKLWLRKSCCVVEPDSLCIQCLASNQGVNSTFYQERASDWTPCCKERCTN